MRFAKILMLAGIFLMSLFGVWHIASERTLKDYQKRQNAEEIRRFEAQRVVNNLRAALGEYCWGDMGSGKKPSHPIPRAENWEQTLRPYLADKRGLNGDPFAVPTAPGQPARRFALNRRMAGKPLSPDPFGQAVLFESTLPGPNAVGDDKNLPPDDGVSGLSVVMLNGDDGYFPRGERRFVVSSITGQSLVQPLP